MKCKYNKMEIAKIVGMDFSAPQRISKICHLRVLWICIRFFVSKSWEGGSANMAQQRPANPYHKNPYGHAAYHLVWIFMLGGLRGMAKRLKWAPKLDECSNSINNVYWGGPFNIFCGADWELFGWRYTSSNLGLVGPPTAAMMAALQLLSPACLNWSSPWASSSGKPGPSCLLASLWRRTALSWRGSHPCELDERVSSWASCSER